MAVFNVKLLKKIEIAEGTMAFHFEKPQDFKFKAGQFADVTLIDPSETDAEGNIRAFTLANAPYEEDLVFVTRMRDTAFKRVLKNLSVGSEVTIDAPHGSYTLHNNVTKPAVFLTGGIGVTPVRSIVLQAAKDKLPHKLFVFYSNRRPEDAAFLDELKNLQGSNPNYVFVGTMTQMDKSKRPWNGEVGYITADLLSKHISDLTVPIYYLSGPAAMVAAMRQTLNDAGVDDDNIKTEEFSGY